MLMAGSWMSVCRRLIFSRIFGAPQLECSRLSSTMSFSISAGATVENAAQSGSLSTISLIDRIAACTEAAASPPLKASSATAAVFKCPITASFSVS